MSKVIFTVVFAVAALFCVVDTVANASNFEQQKQYAMRVIRKQLDVKCGSDDSQERVVECKQKEINKMKRKIAEMEANNQYKIYK